MNKNHEYEYDELRALSYQYTTLLLQEPRLLKRLPYPKIKGKYRILIHLLKILIGCCRYGIRERNHKVYQASKLCFTASTNQLLNFYSVLQNEDQIKVIHFPGTKTQHGKCCLMVLSPSDYILYFRYLIFRIRANKNQLAKILCENPMCFDYVCDIFFVEYFLFTRKIDVETVYISTDLSAFGNVVGKYFLEKDIEVILLPHSPLLEINTPVFYNSVLCRNRAEVEQRRLWLSSRGIRNVGFTFLQKAISKGSGVGVLIKPEDNVTELEEFLQKLKGDIHLRPHPMISNAQNWRELCNKLNLSFSDPLSESPDEFLSKVRIVIGQLSGMHKEMLDIGGLAYVISGSDIKDNYKVSMHQNSLTFSNWGSAAAECNSTHLL